jgi:putative flippase GtrA
MEFKKYKLIFLFTVLLILLVLLVYQDMNEMIQMILGATAIIFASIFSYSIKDDISYRRNQKNSTK